VPVRADLLANLAALAARHHRGASRAMEERRTRLKAAGRALPRPDDILALARQRLDMATGRLSGSLRANTRDHGLRLARSAARLSLKPLGQRLREQGRRLADLGGRQRRTVANSLSRRRDRLQAELKLFSSLNYRSVLARGYAVVRDARNHPVRAAAATRPGQALEIEFADGPVNVHVNRDRDQGSLF
jgi:exodeoxyribonuclease VII large subunit